MMNHHEGGGFLDNLSHFRIWLYYWHKDLPQNKNRRFPAYGEQCSWIVQGHSPLNEKIVEVAKRAEQLFDEGYEITGAAIQYIDPHSNRRHNIVKLYTFDTLLEEGLALDRSANRTSENQSAETSGTNKQAKESRSQTGTAKPQSAKS